MSNQYSPIETFLDNLFTSHASQAEKSMKGKIYDYKLLDDNYCKVVKSGKCYILGYSYSKKLDCNVYTVEDIETGETIRAHQFKLEVKEASK